MFPEKNERLAETRCNTLAVEALLEGVALNALFSPKVLDASSIQQMVPQLLEQIFHRPKASRAASS